MRFTDCIDIVGDRPKKYDGVKRYVSTGALDIDHISEESVEYVDYETRPSRADLMAKPGDVLFAKMAATKKALLLNDVTAQNIYSTGFFAVRARRNVIEPECLLLLINSDVFLSQKDKNASGATQKAITNKGLEAIEITLPPIQEQSLLAKRLKAVTDIISARRQQLAELDTLIKARFVEMFGNPVLNDKGWDQKSLGEITTKIGSGATPKGGKESYQEDGISLIRSMNVHNGIFEYKELAHISDDQAAKLDNVIVEERDVLLNITGASVARSCVVPGDILPARVNQHVCIVRSNGSIVPEFLNALLIDDNYQDLLWNIAGSGATREAITKQQVENLQIIVPPVDLQNEFMQFVAQVDKSRVAVQKALDEAQTLFDSLMQKYFG